MRLQLCKTGLSLPHILVVSVDRSITVLLPQFLFVRMSVITPVPLYPSLFVICFCRRPEKHVRQNFDNFGINAFIFLSVGKYACMTHSSKGNKYVYDSMLFNLVYWLMFTLHLHLLLVL